MPIGLLKPINAGSFPEFPEIAWRGVFDNYRRAMHGTTEASDVCHFGALWACVAVTLGRSVYAYSGGRIFPNIYCAYFGESNDKKSSAQRRPQELLLLNAPIIRGDGSREGLATAMQDAQPLLGPAAVLFYCEEITTVLRQGSGLLEFLSKCFDCPPQEGFKYRKKPIVIHEPTPSLLAATTASSFWRHAKIDDFHAGYGNRIFFLTGQKKKLLARAPEPDPLLVVPVRDRLRELQNAAWLCASQNASVELRLTPDAEKTYARFYEGFHARARPETLSSATRRLPIYVLKIAMVYAALEGTVPNITQDQIVAAIAVAGYAEQCTLGLLDARGASGGDQDQAACEQFLLDWLARQPGRRGQKRLAQSHCVRRRMSSKRFNIVLSALERAGQIRIDTTGRHAMIEAI